MAARARGAAGSAAAARSVGEEGGGGGWLCRVYGLSPAEGALVVYALLPRPASPGSLGRLATVLSGDPGFRPLGAWAWELPRPLAGYAVVELRGGRAHVAIPEEARGALREVGRALEELAARRPAAMLDVLKVSLGELLPRLRDWQRERGVTGFTLRALGSGAVAVELRPPKPMEPEERREFWERERRWETGTVRPLVGEEEARLLEGLGLGALAELAPRRCWAHDGREWRECVFVFEIAKIAPPFIFRNTKVMPVLPNQLDVRIEGSRGTAWVEKTRVFAFLRSLDSELLPLAEEAARAAGELGRLLGGRGGWHDLLDELGKAERRLVGAAPLAEAAERGEARVWMEGGRVKVWLPPEVAASVAERWGGRRPQLPRKPLRAAGRGDRARGEGGGAPARLARGRRGAPEARGGAEGAGGRLPLAAVGSA